MATHCLRFKWIVYAAILIIPTILFFGIMVFYFKPIHQKQVEETEFKDSVIHAQDSTICRQDSTIELYAPKIFIFKKRK
jgi:hypothetical protein